MAAVLTRRRWGWLGGALRLCAMTESLAPGCVHHVVAASFPDVPRADQAAPEDLETSMRVLANLRETVGTDLADLYTDFFWATWTAHSVQEVDAIDGRLLQVLPPEAVPHIRVALAWALLRERDRQDWALDALVDELEQRLADPGTPRAGSLRDVGDVRPRDTWPRDLQGSDEDTIPAAFCMGVGRRAVSPEPRTDLAIALLEAAARLQHSAPPEFYLSVVGSDHPLWVRWTAARIAQQLSPGSLATIDPDQVPPLVRARLVSLRDDPRTPP